MYIHALHALSKKKKSQVMNYISQMLKNSTSMGFCNLHESMHADVLILSKLLLIETI